MSINKLFSPTSYIKYAKVINLYPPFIGAGIRLKSINEHGNRIVVTMKLRWYNKNINGTQFGGSLYAMCDPFYVIACYSTFGNDYIYWDKSASIEYIRPGASKVTAVCEIPLEKLKEMKEEVDRLGKNTYTFTTDIKDTSDKVVARVTKEIYIKKKK